MFSRLLQDRIDFSFTLAFTTQKRLGDFSGSHADRLKSYCINFVFSFDVLLKEDTPPTLQYFLVKNSFLFLIYERKT